MNRNLWRKTLCLICAAVLCLSGTASVSATEGEADTGTISEGNTADTTESPANTSGNSPEETGESTQTERPEPDAYFEPIQTDGVAGWPAGPAVWAESAVVMDLDSGTFLYSKNMDTVKYPASITKIMTTLLAIENSSPNERVTFSEHAIYGIERDSSHIGIRVGEILSMDECWYGMMLESANEVCLAVAEHISGSVEGFVELMNQKAAELGCTNTHFTNPNGLPDENHYTTAHDMALIAQAAYRNKTFRKVCQTEIYCIPKTNICGEERWLSNHHKMLPQKDYAYEGCTGGKTGFTMAALNTLVTYAERDGRRLVCVSLRTNGSQIYLDTASLLDYGFNNFQNITLFSRKTCPGAHMLYPSLYSGQPCTVDALRGTTVVTIPNTAGQEQVETIYSADDANLYRSYLYSQYPVGKESLRKTSFFTQMTSSRDSSDSDTDGENKDTILPIPDNLSDADSAMELLKKIPIYMYLLVFLLVLLIAMEIVLMTRKRRRKKMRKKLKNSGKSKRN